MFDDLKLYSGLSFYLSTLLCCCCLPGRLLVTFHADFVRLGHLGYDMGGPLLGIFLSNICE